MKFHIIEKEDVSSTMDVIRQFSGFCPDGCLVIRAERQQQGRGRQGRFWTSPAGGLYFSLLLKSPWPLSEAAKIPLLTGVAVCEALREYGVPDAGLKWPNDIVAGGQKIAGILVECQSAGRQSGELIVGVGINVNTQAQDLPEGAVSLFSMTGRRHDLGRILEKTLERFGYWHEYTLLNGFSSVLQRWRELSSMIGRRVSRKEKGAFIEGTALDLAEDGALLVRKGDGTIIRITSGEVEYGDRQR